MLEVEQIGGGQGGEQQRQRQQQRGSSYLHQAQLAGLKRLSARAAAGPPKAAGTRRVYFSFSAYAQSVIEHLKRAQIPVAAGLSDRELDRIEATFGFTFPPDLKAILQEGLPLGAGFPNWRARNLELLRTRIELPRAGVLHEVALRSFWCKQWGQRPAQTHHAVHIARTALRALPLLIPLCGHCYIPCSPNVAGNPIFFVYKKDVVYCAYDVADFFDRELFLVHPCTDPPVDVANWGEETGFPLGEFPLQKVSNGGGESFHHTTLDSLRRSSIASSGVDSSEASSSGASEGGAGEEMWGRSLDFLAKQSEGLLHGNVKRTTTGCVLSEASKLKEGRLATTTQQLVTLSRSFDKRSQESGRIHRPEKALPGKASMSKVSLMMPPCSARTPRLIDFWSDIAAHQQKASSSVGAQVLDVLSSPPCCNMNDDHDIITRQSLRLDSITAHSSDADQAVPKASNWVNCYLEEMSIVLRQGGWREEDISDMMGAEARLPTMWDHQLDVQAVLLSLAKEVEFLSTSLKKAGWSIPDISESMKWDSCTL
ncbi:hypothetical protein CY35_11G108100 [Sphagnum magellanicum]|nr:hypothetical protein CY35_11G108100 [Sphagnum magellanicum]